MKIGSGQVASWGKSILLRGEGKYKGPEAGACFAYSSNRRDIDNIVFQ